MKQREEKGETQFLQEVEEDGREGERPALEVSLRQSQQQLEALRQELHQTRQELLHTQAMLGPAAFLAPENVPFKGRFTKYRQSILLERLGKQVLERNAAPGNTLQKVVEFYLAGLESIYPGMLCACFELQHQRISLVAAPSLAPSFTQALVGLPVENVFGTLTEDMRAGRRIICADIPKEGEDPALIALALAHGLRACWCFPVIGAGQKMLGALNVYFKEVKTPTEQEEETLDNARNLLQLIIENKLAEAELRQSNERFYYATVATNDAIWDYDLLAGKINWGVGFEKIFGFKMQEFGMETDIWAQQVHPTDLPRVTASLEEVISHASKDHWREEYWFKRADGTYAYVMDQGTLLRDDKGKPVRLVGAMQDITAQKQAEEELRKLSVIAQETTNGVLVMHPDYTVHWVNEAFTRIMGYSLPEVEGKTLGSFLSGPETDLGTLAYIDDRLRKGLPLECDLIQYTKSQQKCWVKLQVQPLLDDQGKIDQVFALITDITQQKAEEEQLRLLESVITNAQDAIILSEVTSLSPLVLKAIFFNNAFYALTGYTPQEVMGADPSLLNGPATDPAVMRAISQHLQEGKPYEAELQSYRKDGTQFWTQLMLIPMYSKKNQLTHWISMLRDITLRKSYERERELLIADLTQNNADLKQFTFITSHNLRAPLSNLTGIMNLLDLDAVPEGRNRVLLQKFKESTVQLNTIIDDLLEILVIKNKPHTKKEPLLLAQEFERVRQSVDGLLTEIGATITTDFRQVPQVYSNGGYLHSILLNLLSNAIKYRSPDRTLHIEVRTQKLEGKQLLHFTDNGLGIDLNRFGDRIFGLYQRFHQHKDSKGMGLYIAHSQAKAMGGNLTVASEVNQGTTFKLQF